MAGASTFSVAAANADGASAPAAFSITVNATPTTPTPPVISTPPGALAAGTVNVAYSVALAAANNPTSWALADGALPAGLTLDPATGVISGTPTMAGASTFSVAAANADGASAPAAFSITVHPLATPNPPVISTPAGALAAGKVNVPYSMTLNATNNPTSWAVADGALPAGLALNPATGVISGTPTMAGASTFSVTASNAYGALPAVAFSITVAAPTTYAVTWNANGGIVSLAAQTAVDSGAAITAAVAMRPDYKFGGWYLDPALKQYAVFPIIATSDITLYARWKRAVFAPGVAMGPNPLLKSAGEVGIFRDGDLIQPTTLTVYDAVGNAIRKIDIADVGANKYSPLSDDGDRRQVGSWDLRDAKGRPVPEGTYLLRGKVTLVDGTVERVSVLVGVR
jgi:uncharacterized repeat protein (TIGR02543 family)